MTLIEEVARHFFGDPNNKLSKANVELRFGTNGSMSIDLIKERWYDHEHNEGGGLYKLIMREAGCRNSAECLAWLEKQGYKNGAGNGFAPARSKQVAWYDYTDENGKLLFQVVRFEPKEFRQRSPDGKGGWVWKTKGIKRVPYKLTELFEGIGLEHVVYIVEGEKDVETLMRWKLTATCNPAGAGKFGTAIIKYFKGANVVIVADNDDAGRNHVADVAKKLSGAAKRIRLLDLSQHWQECPPKGDISDWVAKGGTVEQLNEIIEALPDYSKAEDPTIEDPTVEDEPIPGELPVIKIKPGMRNAITNQVEDAIINAERGLFLRGGLVVRIDYMKMKTWDEKDVENQIISECGNNFLKESLGLICTFTKFNKRKGKDVICDPPEWISHTLKERHSRLLLPPLNGVSNCPIIRANGELIRTPGYYPSTGIYYDPPGVTFPEIAAAPSKEDAQRALNRIKKLFSTFPWVEESGRSPSRSVALSYLLTTVARRALDFAPMHAFDSPVAGTGKSMLNDIVSLIAIGNRAAVVRHTEDQVEFDKLFSAIIMYGLPMVPIDNCDGPLKGALLNQTLTQEIVNCRILGKSEFIPVRVNTTISANGNNLVIEGDLTRRTICGRMDAGIERPELLKFTYSPIEDTIANRAELVAAVLTVLRAYHVAGKPVREPLGSFTEWSYLVRGALLWLGEADPVETMEDLRKNDPKRSALRTIMFQWGRIWGDVPVTAADMVRMANEWRKEEGYVNQDWRDALMAIAAVGNSVNNDRFGCWLRQNKDKPLRFKQDDKEYTVRIQHGPMSRGANRWKLVKTELKTQGELSGCKRT
jgi:hypothetical protein